MLHWPSSAPKSYDELSKLTFLAPEEWFSLDLPSSNHSQLTAPDNGTLKLKKGNQWIWERQDGGKVINLHNAIRLEYENHTLTHFKASDKTKWVFPDGSYVEKAPTGKSETYKYHFGFHKSGVSESFMLVDEKSWKLTTSQSEHFKFYHGENTSAYINAFITSSKPVEALDFITETFDIEHHGEISIVIPNSLDDYAAYVLPKGNKVEGGRSYPSGIVMFSKDMTRIGSVTEAQQQLYAREADFNLPIHELTHHLLSKGSRQESLANQKRRHPGIFFSEGIAEYVCGTINPSYRAKLTEELYVRIKENTVPATEDINIRKNRNAYIFGSAICFYMEEQWGRESLASYYRLSAQGWNRDAALTKITGMTLEELFNATIAHYESEEKTISEQILTWKNADLPRVKYLQPIENAFHQSLLEQLPHTASDVNDIPHFLETYVIGQDYLSIPCHGKLQGPQGEIIKVRGAKKKSYTISFDELTVQQFYLDADSPQVTQIQYKEHTITNYKDGTREWIFPDGSFLSVNTHGKIVRGKI